MRASEDYGMKAGVSASRSGFWSRTAIDIAEERPRKTRPPRRARAADYRSVFKVHALHPGRRLWCDVLLLDEAALAEDGARRRLAVLVDVLEREPQSEMRSRNLGEPLAGRFSFAVEAEHAGVRRRSLFPEVI